MSYAIQWNLLSQDERDSLQGMGVAMHPSSMAFTTEPTWDDWCSAIGCILELKNRTSQEGNHIDFAVGDCIVAGEELFGEVRVWKWLEEYLPLPAIRRQLLTMAGGTLILLQELEYFVQFCCAAMQRFYGVELGFEDFFALDLAQRKRTLGRVAHTLKKADVFGPTFQDELSQFVSDRNQFVHNLWLCQWQMHERSAGPPTESELQEIHDFIVKLVSEATAVRDVFRGFLAHLYESAAVPFPPELRTHYEAWTRYIPDFTAACRRADEQGEA